MAFDDLPKIDPPSEHDHEARNRLEAIISQKAGFIPREQVPDKGNDYMVELIEQRLAKNNHFCVQLKSIETPTIIENGGTISFSWETSRLGYVMRHKPIYGILVIYDVSTGTLYYEYVEKLYSKLMDRETDGWKANDKVNVHVPISNIMHKDSVAEIHTKYLSQFINLEKMIDDHAASYDLPTAKMGFVTQFDLDKNADIVEILQRWGVSDVQVNDLPIIHDLITRLPNSEIIKDKTVCILAALAFNEAGKIADSVFYAQRAEKRFELNTGEQRMIRFIKLKNDYSLGLLDGSGFISESKILLEKTDDLFNRLTLRLNILNFELMQIKPFMTVPDVLLDELINLADTIRELDEQPNKYYLKLWHVENLALFISTVRAKRFNEMAILEQFGRTLSMPERLSIANRMVAMQRLLANELNSVDEFAKKTDNKLMKAYAIQAYARSQLSFETDLINFAKDPGDLAEREKWLAHHINLTQHGVSIFVDSNLLGPAYNLMCLGAELHRIAVGWYGLGSPVNEDKLSEGLTFLEEQLELPSYASSLDRLISIRRKDPEERPERDPHHSMEYLTKLDHPQMQSLVETIILSGKFPNAKKEHMLHEMESFKLFYERCKNRDFYPMVMPLPNDLVYSISPTYRIGNRSTGLVSIASGSMDSLLKSFGH